MAQFTATSKAAEAPNVEDAMYDALLTRVESTTMKSGEFLKDKVNGDPKLKWFFTLLDGDGNVMYDKGDPIEVDKLTGVGFNIKSKTVPGEVRILKALLTKAEFDKFTAGEGTPDSDEDASDGGLLGRKVQVEVFTKDTGWPGIGNVVAPTGGQKGKSFAAAE